MREQRAVDSGRETVRARIVEAAMTLFGEHGFEGTKTSDIVGLARTSKRAIYANFADKHAILEAVLERFISGRFERIDMTSRQSAEPRKALISVLGGLREASRDAMTLAMYRMMIAELDKLPSLAERANRLGLEQALAVLRQPLSDLGVIDQATAGRLLYDMLVLAPLHRRLLGVSEHDVEVESIADVILSGFGRTSAG